MLQCINEISSSVFTGSLQQLYLETKATELFLLQIQALKNNPLTITKLKPSDIECLHQAKLYIEKNYHTPCTIIRSEEHTSELQSRENLVCRLLLEKKKKQHTSHSAT